MTWLSWLSFSKKERKRIDRPKVYVDFCLIIFLLNQSKIDAVPEPRTGHFRGLVGFETKANDMSFKAKAKDFKMGPRD